VHSAKWPRILALLITAGAAGCVLGAVAHAAPVEPRRQHWQVVNLPVAAGAPHSYAEPGIAVGPDGSTVINAATANTGAPPTFWISRDGGGAWAAGRDFDPTAASTGDADMAIGSDGYLYALNLGYNPAPPGQPTNPTVLVYRSRDGLTWSGPGSFPPPHGADQPDRPWLVVDPRHPASVDVVNSEGGGNVIAWRSLDHGAHFAGPYPVTQGANSQAALALGSRPLFDPTADGRLFMLYETATSSGGMTSASAGTPLYEFPMTQLSLATSTDGGLSWSNRLVLDTAGLSGPHQGATLGHLLVASAIDAAGNLYATFSLRDSASPRTEIYLVHSADHGATWSSPVAVDAPTSSNVMPALAVSPGGAAYLSWYGSVAEDFRSPTAAWVEMFAEAPDPLVPHPAFVSGQVSGTAPVHVGGIDTAGAVGSDLGANWGLRDFQSIAVDVCGRPHPVWADDNGTPVTQTASPQSGCADSTVTPVPSPSTPCTVASRLIFHINRVPHGRVVRVAAFVNGRRVLLSHGRDVTSISFARPPSRLLKVKIVTTNNKGGEVITVRTFRGCGRGKVMGRTRRHRMAGAHT
jgi:hypothetical protein